MNSLYNNTVADLQNSKAKLVADITNQLKVNYEHQINNLKEQTNNAAIAQQKRMEELQQLSQEKVQAAE